MQANPTRAQLLFPGADPAAPLRAAEAMADRLGNMLQVARALADAKRSVDISGLDGLIGRFCAQALDLEPEDGRVIRPRLAALLAELNLLERALTDI